jgi:hypothetical protein|tara:strand:- start:628 stop:1110 length:483 start_codon:yes stop_codon:yes gene_type:complete
MNINNFKIYAVIFTFLSINNFFSQDSFNSSGTNIVSSSGSVSNSIGQLFYNTIVSNDGQVSAGVQQTYTVTNVGLNTNTLNNISVYPNPVSNNLTLTTSNSIDNIGYSLYDFQGKLIIDGIILSEETTVSTSNLSVGTYFINVYNNQNQKSQTFKIIKNK